MLGFKDNSLKPYVGNILVQEVDTLEFIIKSIELVLPFTFNEILKKFIYIIFSLM